MAGGSGKSSRCCAASADGGTFALEQMAKDSARLRSSSLGRDRNVRRSKSTVIASVRFHGRSESILAIRQYPNMTSAKVPTAGSQKGKRIGGKKQMISSSVYARRS